MIVEARFSQNIYKNIKLKTVFPHSKTFNAYKNFEQKRYGTMNIKIESHQDNSLA